MTARERRSQNLAELRAARELPGVLFATALSELRLVKPLSETRRTMAKRPIRLAHLRGR